MRRRLATIGLFLGLTLLATGPATAQTPTTMPLVGSWQLTFIPNTPAAAVPVTPIPGLATFTTDGSMIETDGTEVVGITVTAARLATSGTPGHGIWQVGPAISNFFIRFISLQVNPNGTLHAKRIVTITAMLDSTGTQLNGNYSFQLVDPTAKVIGTGSGTLTGEKIPHPLLP